MGALATRFGGGAAAVSGSWRPLTVLRMSASDCGDALAESLNAEDEHAASAGKAAIEAATSDRRAPLPGRARRSVTHARFLLAPMTHYSRVATSTSTAAERCSRSAWALTNAPRVTRGKLSRNCHTHRSPHDDDFEGHREPVANPRLDPLPLLGPYRSSPAGVDPAVHTEPPPERPTVSARYPPTSRDSPDSVEWIGKDRALDTDPREFSPASLWCKAGQ